MNVKEMFEDLYTSDRIKLAIMKRKFLLQRAYLERCIGTYLLGSLDGRGGDIYSDNLKSQLPDEGAEFPIATPGIKYLACLSVSAGFGQKLCECHRKQALPLLSGWIVFGNGCCFPRPVSLVKSVSAVGHEYALTVQISASRPKSRGQSAIGEPCLDDFAPYFSSFPRKDDEVCPKRWEKITQPFKEPPRKVLASRIKHMARNDLFNRESVFFNQ